MDGSGAAGSASSSEVVGDALPPTLTNQVAMAWSGTEVLLVSSQLFDVAATSMHVAVFDPGSGGWEAVRDPVFEHPLFSPAVHWLRDRFLVVGVLCESVVSAESSSIGCAPGTAAAATYDPRIDAWESIDAPPVIGSGISLIQSSSDEELAVVRDGERVHLYDATTARWSTFTPFGGSSVECIVDGEVLIAGGDLEPRVQTYAVGAGALSQPIDLDAASATWSFGCGPSGLWAFPMPAPGATPASAALFDGTSISTTSPVALGPVVRSDRQDRTTLVQSSDDLLGVFDEADGTWNVLDPPGGDIKAIALVSEHQALIVALPVDGNAYELITVPI